MLFLVASRLHYNFKQVLVGTLMCLGQDPYQTCHVWYRFTHVLLSYINFLFQGELLTFAVQSHPCSSMIPLNLDKEAS